MFAIDDGARVVTRMIVIGLKQRVVWDRSW